MKYTQQITKNAGVIRKILGITQMEMSEAIGISRPTWSQIENGKIELTNAHAIALFAYSTQHVINTQDSIDQQMLEAIFGINELALSHFMTKLTTGA